MLATDAPFSQYFDLDGRPLDAGFLHFGQVDQNPETNPVTVYWDAALTQPAAQPVRTLNGFPIRAGSIGFLYAADNYSLTIRNRIGSLVLYAPSSLNFNVSSQVQAVRTDLLSTADALKNAGMVGLNATLNYAVATLGRHVTEWVSPHDFPWSCPTDGLSDATASLNACFTWAAANGRGVRLNPGRTYKIASIAPPANTHLETGGALFRADGTVVGNGVNIDIGAGSVVDCILFTTPAGGSDRPVQFAANCRCEWVSVTADAQAGGLENLDGAVQIRGSNTHIGKVFVENYDTCLVIYRDSSPIENVTVGYFKAKSYVRGAYVRNYRHVTIGFAECIVASVNATTSPGHNAVVTAGGEDFSLAGYYITDSGEHAIRIGGSNGVELRTKYVQIGNGMIVRPGQCGIKVNPGTNLAPDRHKYVTIGNVTTVDVAATSTTGSNEDAVRIENTDHWTVGKIVALKEAKAASCNCGLYSGQSTNGTLLDWYIDTPNANAIQISEISEGVAGAVGAHDIRGGWAKNAGGNTILIDCPTQAISSIIMDGWESLSPVNDALEVNCASATGCFFRGVSYTPGVKHYDGSISAGIVLDITSGGQYRGIGPADSANAQNAPIGQSWHRDSGFDPAAITGDIRGTVVLTSTNGVATGIYTPALVGTLAQSNRRRWAIAGYAGGADADQYGIRFFVYGATTTPSDALTLAGEWDYQGFLLPGADNTRTLGSAALRWSTVYAGTGAINTSDEREKQDIEGIPDTWLDAWADVQYSRFRFRDAVQTKGDAARWHCGLVAQRVIDAFRKRDVDPFAAGIVCWDEWGERFEPVMASVLDEKGRPTGEQRPTGERVKVQKAGDRFGVRYEEALVLEAALMRREVARLKAGAK